MMEAPGAGLLLKKNTIVFPRLFLLLMLTSLAACSPTPPAQDPLPVQPLPRSNRAVSPNLNARVYFDATSSMAGFTAIKSNQGFVAFIQRMEQAFAIGWRNSSIDCYKFGLKVTRLNADRCYLLPGEPGFYDLNEKDNVTRIDLVLGQVDPAGLSVILTDLYQDDADLGAIFQAVKKHVFSRHLSIGIAAVMSPFSGAIYDIGLHKDVRQWKKERPFYALVIGQKGDVIRCFEQFSIPPLSIPRDRLLILSADLLERLLGWDTTSRLETDRIAEDGRIIPRAGGSAPVKGFRLQSDEDRCRLIVHLAPEFSPFHPVFDLGSDGALQPKLELQSIRKGKQTPSPVDGATAVFSASKALKAGAPGSPAIEIAWQPRRFRGDYLLKLQVEFDPAALRLPAFVSGWSVPVSEALVDDRFNGAKTQNLQELVMGLWRIMLEQYGHSLGAFYLYFQK
jgi:hypothetical protein